MYIYLMVLYGGNEKKNRSLCYYFINCTTRNVRVIKWLSEPSLPRVTCSLWLKSLRRKP